MSCSRVVVCALFAALVAACGDDASPPSTDGASTCMRDVECDDGLFCNGTETCGGDASPNGCSAGAPPCEGRCDESRERCLGCEVPDADGDGHGAIACGGDDCDDDDADRFPGNVETCDSVGRDEDCDPTTLGEDRDRDGFVDDRCCNVQESGALRCGDDCDDLRDSVSPSALDVCNERDDDCDGRTDEEPSLVFYVDSDGDGWGADGDPDDTTLPSETRPIRACSRPDGYSLQPGDCDDEDARAAPGSLEICGSGDEDCDGEIDEYGEGVDTPAIDPRLWYVDADGDGWGNTDRVELGCVPPDDGRTYARRLGDCRDDRDDVNPGVTTPQSVPSCPDGIFIGDMGIPLVGFHCGGGRWECVARFDRRCGVYAEIDAWWDYDCSGALETFPVVQPYTYDDRAGVCAVFGPPSSFRSNECGLRSGLPVEYDEPIPPDCQPAPIGELGPVRCL
jgi:hypothetical protein